jgi:DNA-binding NtrC family response regulator
VHSILIVEEDKGLLDQLSGALEDAGYPIERSGNGKEAFTLRNRPRPSLILLDLDTLIVSGSQFLKMKRNDPALVKVPVVAIGGAASAEIPRGIAAFVRKPVNMRVLLDVVANYC